MNILKSPTAAGVVTAAAFTASAAHIFTVVAESNPSYVAWVYPIGIDGLLYVGIRAMQTGRKGVGAVALLIGAAYSLMFNAHAEGALRMPAWLIAASMPVCFFAAVLIETTAHKAEEIEAPTETAADHIDAEWKRIEQRADARAELDHAKAMAEIERQAHEVWSRMGMTNQLAPEPIKVEAKVEQRPSTPKIVRPAIEGTSVRLAGWDVEKAVRLLADGRTDADVLGAVDGLTAKPWQRTKRAVRLLADVAGEDASKEIESIAGIVGQSAAHITRVYAAMKENS